MMRIVIGGDIGASQNNNSDFCNAEESLFSNDIQKICKEADLVVLNLEKPLTDVLTPLGKCPPDYVASTKTINGIKLLNPKIITLANNHIMDQKAQGLRSTISVLEQNGIMYVGAGRNLKDARKPVILNLMGLRIGVYACCEKEFSFATDLTPGANVFDPLETFDEIQKLKLSVDYLIVLFHGGMQDYPYPTPGQQRICRKMCEKGADLVVCQHSHIIGCKEEYAHGTIIYGQGNLLLDDLESESWQSGLLIQISLEKDKSDIDYVPIKTDHHRVVLHPQKDYIVQGFIERSNAIRDLEFVEKSFIELSKGKLSDYLLSLSGKNRLMRRILRRTGIAKHYNQIYSEDACNRILDYIYCDSHREAIAYGLEYIRKT